jgi:hypothetical protein
MTQLHRRARDLIATAADGDGPTPAERARLRASVLARVGATVVAGSAGTAAAGTKAAAAVAVAAKGGAPAAIAGLTTAGGGSVAAVAAKVLAIAALTVGVSTGGYVVLTHKAQTHPVASPSVVAQTSDLTSTTSRGLSGGPLASDPPAASVVPVPAAQERPLLQRAQPSTRTAPPLEAKSSTAPTSVAAPEALEAETRSLRAALSALRDGQNEAALAALDLDDARYAGGALDEERAAARIDALCALGRTSQARSLAVRFLDAHPRSLLAARVQASCGGAGSVP